MRILRRCSLTEAFTYAPSSLSDVHAGTTAASDTVHNILRLTVETVADGVCCFGSMKNSLRCYVLACLTTGTTAGTGSSSRGLVGPSVECTRISLRFLSRRYETRGGSGKIPHVSGSVDKMLKLSNKIFLIPVLKGW